MNLFSRFLQALSPACAVLVAGATTLAVGPSASAKAPSFSLSSRAPVVSPPREAFVRVGEMPDLTPRDVGGFSTLLGPATPSPRGWILAAPGDPNSISFQDATVSVSEGAGSIVLTVVRGGDTSAQTNVKFAAVDGTATKDDYGASSGFITFTPGIRTQQISIPITEDALVEPLESFTVVLSEATNIPGATTTITNSPATVNIDDNESSVQFAATTATVNEFENSVTLTIQRTGNTAIATRVDVATSNGTALAGQDYTAVAQSVNFAANQTNATITIPITDDLIDETDENFKVTLSNPGASTGLGNNKEQTVTIIDDDSTTVAFELRTASVNEGAGTITVNVTRGGDASQPLSVDYTFANGTFADFAAINNQDFTGAEGTVVFGAGELTQSIVIPIIDDGLPENTEDFSVTLSNPRLTNGPIAGSAPSLGNPATISISIVDNEPHFSLESKTYSVAENRRTVNAIVRRSGGTLNVPASVSYVVTGRTANNGLTATSGEDFSATNQTLDFAANQTIAVISVTIIDDIIDEDNETFAITLTNPTPAGFQVGPNTQAIVSILDNDEQPSATISDVSQSEGNDGNTNQTFTVTLNGVAGRAVNIAYATSDGSATDGLNSTGTASPTEDRDYVATSGLLTIPAGASSGTINVPIIGDTKFENDEGYVLTLSDSPFFSRPTNAIITVKKVIGQIVNDDPLPVFSFSASAASVAENAGNATLTVNRTGDTTGASSVVVTTASGSARSGSDFSTVSQTLIFTSGQTSQNINIPILDDLANETNETFTVSLSNPQVATVGANASTTVTITDDDAIPGISINDVSVVEGNSGTTNLSFTASLSAVSEQIITVDFATADGGATAGSDYEAQSGTLTFAPGTLQQTITVVVNGDINFSESDETLLVNLSNPQNATLADASATGTIRADDTPPTFSNISFTSTAITVDEGAASAVLTLSRSTGTDRAASLDFATSDGTATSNSDFAATSGTVNFAVGETTAQITIPLIDDTLQELNSPETFTVTLSNEGGNAVLPIENTATVSITDNDGTPTLSVSDASVNEGNSGITSLVFTVSLQPQSQKTVTVTIATTTGGTASVSGRGQDFRLKTSKLTFAPGVAIQTFAVEVGGDPIVEPDETILVQLSGAQNASVDRSRAVGTIVNDDQPGGGGTIAFLSSSYSVTENVEGGRAAVTLGRSGNIDLINKQASSVRFTMGTGSATPGSDYRPVNGIATFAPGQTTKTVFIPITNDTVFESDESVPMTLSDPSNNAILASTNTSATLTIVDEDQRTRTPRAESLLPRDSVGSPFNVTATYSSDFGINDLSQVLIQIGGNQEGNGLRAIYNPKTNRLSLDPSNGTSAAPGARVLISNAFGSLDCGRTTVERLGNTLRVKWNLRVRSTTAQSVFIGATSVGGESVFVRRGTWRPAVAADSSANGS